MIPLRGWRWKAPPIPSPVKVPRAGQERADGSVIPRPNESPPPELALPRVQSGDA